VNADLVGKKDGYLVFKIEGDGFLRFMVRNIIGTLLDVGLGKMTTNDFKKIFESKDRNLAGATAPAYGLFLKQVKY
jgi:tRNA pseudouridine38-40 synthase